MYLFGRKKSLILSAALVVFGAATPAFAGFRLNPLVATIGKELLDAQSSLLLSGATIFFISDGGSDGYGELDGDVCSLPVTGGTATFLGIYDGYSANGAGLVLSNGILYGSAPGTQGSNDRGEVFSVPASGGSVTAVGDLVRDTVGTNPESAIILSGGTIYGTTTAEATVFSVPVAGGKDSVVASFKSDALYGGVLISGNTLYGTTSEGGEVFSVPISGGTPTVLASLGGAYPTATMILAGNTLYGTTEKGGAFGYGEVFSVPTSGGTPTVLASFSTVNSGVSGLTLYGSVLYGTTSSDGPYGQSTVFSVPITGGTPKVVVAFNGANGTDPVAGLTLSGNTFYGTAENVFNLTANPVLSLTTTPPTVFGSKVGALALTGGSGSYTVGSTTFAATPTGYLTVSGFNPSTDTEVFALEINDSIPGNLAADLADAASEINAATYPGYTLTASTTDPLSILGNGYDFYITITNDTLGTGSPYFGFDFTQLNGTSDTLTVTAAAAVPEPAGLSLLAIGAVGLLRRRGAKFRIATQKTGI